MTQVESASVGRSSLLGGVGDVGYLDSGSPWDLPRGSYPELPVTPQHAYVGAGTAYSGGGGSQCASVQSSHLDPMAAYRLQLRKEAREEENALAMREQHYDIEAWTDAERRQQEECELEADCARRLAMIVAQSSSPCPKSDGAATPSTFAARTGMFGGSFASAAGLVLHDVYGSAAGSSSGAPRGTQGRHAAGVAAALAQPLVAREMLSPAGGHLRRVSGARRRASQAGSSGGGSFAAAPLDIDAAVGERGRDAAPLAPGDTRTRADGGSGGVVDLDAARAAVTKPLPPLQPALQLLKPTSQQRKLMSIVRRQLLPHWLPEFHLLRALLCRHPDDMAGVVELCDAFRGVCDMHGIGCLQLADIYSTFQTRAFYWVPSAALVDDHLTLYFDGARYKQGRDDGTFSDLTDMPRLVLSVLECMAHHHPVATTRHGIHIVLDFAGLSAGDVSTFQKLLSLINTAYPINILSVIILNASTWVSAWWNTKAPFVSTLPPSSAVHNLKSSSLLADSGLLRRESMPTDYGGPLTVNIEELMDMMRAYLQHTDLSGSGAGPAA